MKLPVPIIVLAIMVIYVIYRFVLPVFLPNDDKDYFDDTGVPSFSGTLGTPTNDEGLPLEFGDTLARDLEQPAATDTYTFDADAGDVVRVQVAATTGEFQPLVEVFDAQQTRLARGGTLPDATPPHFRLLRSPFVRLDVSLERGGSFLVAVSANRPEQSGAYELTPQRLNNPVGARLLALEETVAGVLEEPTAMNVYAFDGTADDTVHLQVTSGAEELRPRAEVFDSRGSRVRSIGEPSLETFRPGVVEVVLPLEQDGRFFVFISAARLERTGEYELKLSRAEDTPESRTL